MFSVSFGELVLLAIIGMVVVGPRNLPQMMRTLGRSLSKARRMALNLREQSGIDEILRHEGIEKEFSEFRKLATGRILDLDLDALSEPRHAPPARQREYPTGGIDTYGALPEDVAPYAPPGQAPALEAPSVERTNDPYGENVSGAAAGAAQGLGEAPVAPIEPTLTTAGVRGEGSSADDASLSRASALTPVAHVTIPPVTPSEITLVTSAAPGDDAFRTRDSHAATAPPAHGGATSELPIEAEGRVARGPARPRIDIEPTPHERSGQRPPGEGGA